MKKFVRYIIGLSLLFCIFPTNISAKYNDVPSSHKYADEIEYLEKRNVLENTHNFRPNRMITREEFIRMLIKNADIDVDDVDDISSPYTDVSENSEFLPYILKAYELGLIPKTKTLTPKATINKFEVIRSILFIEGIPVPRYVKDTLKFRDVRKDSHFTPYIKKAVDLNIVNPKSKHVFGLFNKLTRSEVANILYRVQKHIHEEEPITIEVQPITIGPASDVPNIDILENVFESITEDYVSADQLTSKDKEALMYAAIKAMVSKLGDQHSAYLTPDEADALKISLNNELEGIGAYINDENGQFIIVAPLKGSPAEKAGIRAGDIIVQIDGETTDDLELIEVIGRIKGPKGTKVELTIQRKGTRGLLKFNILRDKITIPSVELNFDEGIAHLSLNHFSSSTNLEFGRAVDQILAEYPNGIILDLRNNPGGYLDSSVNVLGYFFEKDTEVLKVQYGRQMTSYETSGDAELKDIKLVILANEGSASASEIVIGALTELKHIPLLGTKTFGKGSVQELDFFSDGSVLKLTIAKWLTPNEVWINGEGFEPDIEVTD